MPRDTSHVVSFVDVGPNKPIVYSCEFDGEKRTIATQTLRETETKACSPDSAIDSPGFTLSVSLSL